MNRRWWENTAEGSDDGKAAREVLEPRERYVTSSIHHEHHISKTARRRRWERGLQIPPIPHQKPGEEGKWRSQS